MAEEPERSIENLLRRCGKQRLPAERFELHPANRRLLQAEVASVYGQRTPKPGGFSLRILRRLAWSFGALTIIAAAAWLILSNSNSVAPESRLARNDQTAVSSPSLRDLAEQTDSSQENEVKPSAATDRSLALLDTNRAAPAQAAPPTDAPALIAMNSVLNEPAKDVAAKSESAAIAVPAGASAGTPASRSNPNRYGLASTANATRTESLSATKVQKFARETSTQAKVNAALPVLASFQYEQTGSEVRIIDQDGSVYVGTATATPTASIPQLARFAQSSSRVSDGLQPPNSSSLQNSAGLIFHVSGTNVTLKQPVVFDGQWLGQTNIAGLRQFTNAMMGGVASGLPSGTTMPRISGSLKVGQGQGVLIKAVPTGP